MPPRSKQSKINWHQCSSCNCTVSSRDASLHADQCSPDDPMQLNTLNLSNVKHGFFSEKSKCFVGLLTVFGDVPDHLDKSTSDSLAFMHPSAMHLGGFCIGQPVVVDNTHVFTAWPCHSVSLTSVGVSQNALDVTLKLQPNVGVLVYKPVHAHIPATELNLTVRSQSSFADTQVFQAYVASKLVDQLLTANSLVPLTYYGCPCELRVSKIIGEGQQVAKANVSQMYPPVVTTSLRQYDVDDPVRNLSQDIDNLQLNTTGSSIREIETPKRHLGKHEDFRSPSGESDVPLLPRRLFERTDNVFFVVNRRTKVVIESDSDVLGNDSKKQIKTVSVEDIGGLHKQLTVITDMIRLCLDTPDVFQQQGLSVPHGVLLYGPPGTGKTMLAGAILTQSPQTHVITVSGSDIWSKYYGESEAKLVQFFREARERAPSLMFIDELNAMCPRRESSNNEVEKRVIACLVSQFDAMVAGGDRVFVIAATSKRDDIDPALRRPGRLDGEVEIGVPSMKDRVDILTCQLRNVRHVLTDTEISSVAERAHGFVGADLSAICKEAGLHALKRTELTKLPDGAVIRQEDLAFGLGAVQPSAMREVAIEIPQVLWEDIGGQSDLKHKLRQAIEWPLKHPEAFRRLGIRPPRGLLMYGPPGCSKTMIAKALARESGINFIAIKGPELFSKWVGESERAVREVFRKARAAAPAIVFFDEIDALAGERGSGAGGGADVSDRVLAQLLTEMDGVETLQDVTVVAATNRPDRIDKALLRPGRLDRVVYVPLPDAQTRREIFSIQFRKMPVADDVNIDELVASTEKYSGAEVTAVCHEAALCALTEDLDIALVHSRHFQQAVCMVTPRTTPEMIDFYDTYNKRSQLHVI